MELFSALKGLKEGRSSQMYCACTFQQERTCRLRLTFRRSVPGFHRTRNSRLDFAQLRILVSLIPHSSERQDTPSRQVVMASAITSSRGEETSLVTRIVEHVEMRICEARYRFSRLWIRNSRQKGLRYWCEQGVALGFNGAASCRSAYLNRNLSRNIGNVTGGV